MLLAVDPGTNAGWARFQTGRLVACGLNEGFLHSAISRVVIERPIIYKSSNPKDIIKLAVKAGEWGGLCRALFDVEPEYVEPAEWKGQLSKEICEALVAEELSKPEQNLIPSFPKSKKHNVLDAIGIGLWVSKRLFF